MAGTWTPRAPMAGGKRTQVGAVGFPGATTGALVSTLSQGALLQFAGIYAIGGSFQQSALKRTERFDIVANAWTALADMPTARSDFAVVAAHTWIYAIGGTGGANASTTVARFEPATGTWITVNGLAMATGRWSLEAAAVVVSGKLRVYAIGGNTGGWTNLVQYFEITAAGEGKWQSAPALNIKRDKFGIAVANNSIYCVGGTTDFGALDSIEELKPGANSWTLYKGALSAPRSGLGAAYSGGSIFAFGGVGAAGAVKTVDSWDPSTKKSSTAWAPMPTARSNFGTGTVPVFVMSPKDKIPVFVVGGDEATGPQDTTQRFDP